MDRGTWIFWTLIAALGGASVFFTVGAERQRRAALHAQAALQTGDVVSVSTVVDGDTVVVSKTSGELVAVKLLGVKAFTSSRDKDPAAPYGRAAIDALRKMVEHKPARVLLHDPPKDKHGRTLAALYVEGHDVGLELLRRGHAMVYTVYPFAGMAMYLEQQEHAKAEQLGLWANPDMVARAEALSAEWRKVSP